MKKLVTAFAKNEDGATAIEYGLIAAGISVAIASVVFTLGGEVEKAFNEVESKMINKGGSGS